MAEGYPDNNPKTAQGALKVPLHLVAPSMKHYLAMAMEDGARKYGAYNWREKKVSVSVYKAASERHWDAFWDGEDNCPKSRVHHLAHAMACAGIVLDAMSIGMLNDDRPTEGAVTRLQEEYLINATKPELPVSKSTPEEQQEMPSQPGCFWGIISPEDLPPTRDQINNDEFIENCVNLHGGSDVDTTSKPEFPCNRTTLYSRDYVTDPVTGVALYERGKHLGEVLNTRPLGNQDSVE